MKTRFNTIEVQFLSQADVIHMLADDHCLRRRLTISEEDEESGEITDLFIDCDHVKVAGENGRGDVMFTTFNIDETTYIIGYDEIDKHARKIIMWWLEGAEGDKDVDNNWKAWDTVKEGVAYRGGAGYYYDLFAKSLLSESVFEGC